MKLTFIKIRKYAYIINIELLNEARSIQAYNLLKIDKTLD